MTYRPKVYMASKLQQHNHWKALIDLRPDIDFVARWPHIIGTVEDSPENAALFWEHDFEDIDAADALIIYGEYDESLKGALVEAGYAIARRKLVVVVGGSPSFGTWQFSKRVVRHTTLGAALNHIKKVLCDDPTLFQLD